MPRDDLPVTVLGRFLTLEMLGMVVLIAVSWGTLTAKVNSLDDQVSDAKDLTAYEVQEAKKVTDSLSSEINQINRKVDVLGANQDHFNNQIEQIDTRLERIQVLLEHRRAAQ